MSLFENVRPGDAVWIFTEEGDKKADVVISVDEWMSRIFVKNHNYNFNLQTGNSSHGDVVEIVESGDMADWNVQMKELNAKD